jgi:hypothetical protein
MTEGIQVTEPIGSTVDPAITEAGAAQAPASLSRSGHDILDEAKQFIADHGTDIEGKLSALLDELRFVL